MPASYTIHFNPPVKNRKTRCGLLLSNVRWREDATDVNCNSCLKLIALDAKKRD